MKSKILAALVLGVLTIAFQNCERSPFIAYEGKIDSLVKQNEVEHNRYDYKLVSAKYFRGGWFGPADVPNWSHDVTIEEKNGVLTVSAKATDALCGKVSQTLSEAQIAELQKLISELEVKEVPADAPLMVDGGTRQITLKYEGEGGELKEQTILLTEAFETTGLYAANGDSLAAYIESLDNSLAMYCQ